MKLDFFREGEIRPAVHGMTMRIVDFVCIIRDAQRDSMLKKMVKLRDKRQDWPSFMYRELQRRTRWDGSKLDIKKFRLDEALTKFGEVFVEKTGFDTEPVQKTIKEAARELNAS